MKRPTLLAAALLALATGAWAQAPSQGPVVGFNGSLGSKAALLMIDGEPRTVVVGQDVRGVKLVSVADGVATIEIDGRRRSLQLGASPASVGTGKTASPNAGRQIVLSSGVGGHFVASGSIEGKATQFLVDTGATSISISQQEADRIGLRYREGRRLLTHTANGTVPANALTLNSVRIGDVEVRNVEAIVIPGQMSHVLLGNSFLTRFQMKRDNDILTLDLRY